MKQVFYINNDAFILFHWNSHRSCTPIVFPHSSAGKNELTEFLSSHPKTPTKVIVDIIEEDFRRESVRSMGASDRKIVTQRYLDRHFRDSSGYTAATYQGKSAEEKNHDNILYSGITNTEQLDEWLEPFTREDIPICGIWSVPLMLTQLKKQLSPPPNSVLVFQQDWQTLRQVLLVNGFVVTSRLTRSQHDEQSLEDFFLDETERMLHFYRRKRFIPYNQKIDVIYYYGFDTQVEQLVATNETYSIATENLASLLSTDYSQQVCGAALFAEKVLKLANASCHYRPEHVLKSYHIFRANQWVKRIGIGCFAASLLGTQLLVSQAYYRQTESKQASLEAKQVKKAYSERYKPIEGVIKNSKEISASVELAAKLRELGLNDPLGDFTRFSQVFQAPNYNDMQLISLKWSQQLSYKKKKLLIDEEMFPKLEVVGQIPVESRNTRHAVDIVNQLASTLGQSGFYATRVTKPPLDYRPERQLQFSTEPDKVIYLSEAGNLGTFKLDMMTKAVPDDK